VCCVGSALDTENTPAFAQADISIAKQPSFDTCLKQAEDEVCVEQPFFFEVLNWF
jgi:hypothetical protein